MSCEDDFGCEYREKGTCFLAEHLKFQAKHGHPSGEGVWDKKQWLDYAARIKKELDRCQLPDELRQALETISPQFAEEIKPTPERT